MLSQARAILWAQWRGLLNYYPRMLHSGAVFSGIFMALWYGFMLFLAWGVYSLVSGIKEPAKVYDLLHKSLFFAAAYWQFVPIILATTGISLELRKLVVYPIPNSQLFAIELLLRTSTSVEILTITFGAMLGALRNPALPWWSAAAFLPFILFNLALSAGVIEVQKRIFARKYLREAAVLLVVLLGAVPQLLLTTKLGPKVKAWWDLVPSLPTPWSITAQLASGDFSWTALFAMTGWVAVAYWFGRSQFDRGLRLDFESGDGAAATPPKSESASKSLWIERLFRWPSSFFPDPLAGLIEKDLRSLARAPRFRLVFFMGFSFGLLIWLPVSSLSGRGTPDGFGSQNFLMLVSGYALLMLGEVCFLNTFGFDRTAAQAYWVFPVSLRQSLIAKNLAAMTFVLLEVIAIALICGLLGLPITFHKLAQSLLVCGCMSLLLMAIGNWTSVSNPRAANPNRSMRSTPAGKTQALLLVVYPLASVPVALAYLAEYAFETPLAFYGVMLFNIAIAAVVYNIALDTAVEIADRERERIVATLSKGEGPLLA
ncbi:hypothetical protein F183_A47110 [Bryobacterales bacterium F-183]|nr:hypothetical protein F183_A47110 [Bryobacterales bacterium F-183]